VAAVAGCGAAGRFRRLGFGARGRAAVAPIAVLALASHALGRGTVRCRAGSRRRWGGGMRGPGSSGRGWRALGCTRCLRGRGGGASTSGLRCRVSEGRSGSGCPGRRTVGVCLPGANNVMSRSHLRQDARTICRSLARSLPLSLSLSLSLSFRDGGASTDVSRHRGRRLQECASPTLFTRQSRQDQPPLECSVWCHELPMCVRRPMRMTLSCSACTCVCLKLLSRFRETIPIDFDLHAGSS
jgi:hypothetical protein